MNSEPQPQDHDQHESIELNFQQQAQTNSQPVIDKPNKQHPIHSDLHFGQLDKQVQQANKRSLLQQKKEEQVHKFVDETSFSPSEKHIKKSSLLTDKLSRKETPESQSSGRSGSLLICIEDSEIIPRVFLQSSPKGQKCISIKVPMYRTITFMKIETQIFILEVSKPGPEKDYQIERRYSDFVEFYEALFYNHPGYVLAPFPGKGLESFMKIKLGIGMQEPGERCEMIEKRMLDLQKFLNYVTHHNQLCNSEELAIFIAQDSSIYEEGKKRLEKYVNENKSLERGSQLKNFIGMGKSLWNSYVRKQQKPKSTQMVMGKNDIEFGVILQTVRTQKQRLMEKIIRSQQIYTSQRSLSEFVDMPTENDSLLKLCTKHASGKQYCRMFADFVEINVLDHYKYNARKFQEIEKSLLFRIQILECLKQARDQGNLQKMEKLARRLEMFQRNFLTDWENIFVDIEKDIKNVHENFTKQWKNHKKLMKKIWRPAKKN